MRRDRLLRGSSSGVQESRRFARVKGAYNEQIDGGVARDPRFVRPANCRLAAAAAAKKREGRRLRCVRRITRAVWVPPSGLGPVTAKSLSCGAYYRGAFGRYCSWQALGQQGGFGFL